MTFEISPHELGACVLQPRRDELARACAVAARVVEEAADAEVFSDAVLSVGVPDARQTELASATWEVLATEGIIPFAWIGDGARRFDAGRELRDAPTSVAMAVALAADTPGVTAAELLAWEVAARLSAWCDWRPSRVQWRLVDPDRWTTVHGRGGGPWRLPAQCAVVALHRADDPTRGLPVSLSRALRRGGRYGANAHWDLDRAWLWRYAADRGLRIPALDAVPRALWDKGFHEVDDPFAPLLRLWSTGYALQSVTADAIILVAPHPRSVARSPVSAAAALSRFASRQ